VKRGPSPPRKPTGGARLLVGNRFAQAARQRTSRRESTLTY